MGKYDEKDNDLVPVLEEPTGDETGEASTTLMPDSAPLLFSKVTLLEQCLRLSVKPIGFTKFMQELLLGIMRTIPCEASSFIELTPDGQSLFFRAAVGYRSDSIVKFLIPRGQGIAGQALEKHKLVQLSSESMSQHHLKALEDAVGFETHNLVAIPIIINGTPFGVFELINRHGESDFTERDLEVLNYVRFYLSKTIEIRLLLNSKESAVA